MSEFIVLGLRILLAFSLFAFLLLAFYVLWLDIKRQESIITQKQAPPIALFYQHDDEVTPYRFALPEILIGRDPACDCVISDSTVSAQHARLIHRQGQWWIEDLRSTNGTFLNHEPVFTPMVITSGDLLQCGQAVLTVSVSEADSKNPPQPMELSRQE